MGTAHVGSFLNSIWLIWRHKLDVCSRPLAVPQRHRLSPLVRGALCVVTQRQLVKVTAPAHSSDSLFKPALVAVVVSKFNTLLLRGMW